MTTPKPENFQGLLAKVRALIGPTPPTQQALWDACRNVSGFEGVGLAQFITHIECKITHTLGQLVKGSKPTCAEVGRIEVHNHPEEAALQILPSDDMVITICRRQDGTISVTVVDDRGDHFKAFTLGVKGAP